MFQQQTGYPERTNTPQLVKSNQHLAISSLALAISCVTLSHASESSTQTLTLPSWSAEFVDGSLVGIVDNDGTAHLSNAHSGTSGPGLEIDEKQYYGQTDQVGDEATIQAHTTVQGLPETSIATTFRADADTGEIILSQTGASKRDGVSAVEWTLGPIPFESKILVPAGGGTQLDADTPESRHAFHYPHGWEAQLVIIKTSDESGFYVWSDDHSLRFKELIVTRTDEGWMMRFITFNNAPFDDLTAIQTPDWRIGVYKGTWRVPAERYRTWRNDYYKPTLLAEQTPDWVGDIRVQILNDGNIERLEAFAQQVDPSQTLIYVLDWRKQVFDYEYPEYTDFATTTLPMIRRAKELGFRVMLHVNHFSVAHDHPSYEATYKDLIARSPYGEHERLKYTNTRVSPPIINYYVNPASKVWREDFIQRMEELVEISGVDALHLDQNFHAHNDHNGIINGMTYNEGVIALHSELRERMPHIALCGENVNELTYPYLSFAQRTVWSAMRGTIDRLAIGNGHPISSYLMRPYVKFVGWPGYPSGHEQPQVHAAWMEDYRTWGVLPSIKILRRKPNELLDPTGFFKQQLDEAKFWTSHHVDEAVDGPWPSDVAFPFKADDGESVYRMMDGRTLHGSTEISRTVTDTTAIEGSGSVDGWLFYNESEIFGLNPQRWYPYFTQARDLSAFHVSTLPSGMNPLEAVETSGNLFMRFGYDNSREIVALSNDVTQVTTGLMLKSGEERILPHPIERKQNASLLIGSGVIRLTPPSTAPMQHDPEGDLVNVSVGLGEVFMRYTVSLPKDEDIMFMSEVGIDGRAEGKSNGLLFTVHVSDGSESASESFVNDSGQPRPLNLDLTAFAGRTVTITLSAGPGPDNDATKDQGLWYHPHLVRTTPDESDALAFTLGEAPWQHLVVDGESFAITKLRHSQGTHTLQTSIQSRSILFLREPAYTVEASASLAHAPATLTVTDRFNNIISQSGPSPLATLKGHTIVRGCKARVDIPLQFASDHPAVADITLVHSGKSTVLPISLQIDGETIATQGTDAAKGETSLTDVALEQNGTHLLTMQIDASRSPQDVTIDELVIELK